MSFQKSGIIGAGAWGTALAMTGMRAERNVMMWSHSAGVAQAINDTHENRPHLPSVILDSGLCATVDLKDLAACDVFVLAVPAQHLRETARALAKISVRQNAPLVVAAKGIEQKTEKLMSEIIAEECPAHPVAILSGPSFADEVAKGLPTALTLAIRDKQVGEQLVQAMATPSFRLYVTDDVIGAQMGGALKNVMAIACGIVAGRGMGENACAALMTRGLAEMTRLGVALGGRAETLMGLSGLGDLALTCSSTRSRNMSLGLALGQGRALRDILAERNSVTEGVTTASAALALAQKQGVTMPIVAAVDAVLNHGLSIDDAIRALLARPFKGETA